MYIDYGPAIELYGSSKSTISPQTRNLMTLIFEFYTSMG